MSHAKTARNAAMLAERRAGALLRELAAKYRLSINRVAEILANEARRAA